MLTAWQRVVEPIDLGVDVISSELHNSLSSDDSEQVRSRSDHVDLSL